MRKARVLLAEDHTIVAEGLNSLLKDEVELIGTVGDGHALVEAAGRLKPDVIVADISMPLLNGLDAARQLKRKRLSAKIIFLTMHPEVPLAKEAFRAGASGYLLKHSAGKELILAIRQVLEGRSYVTPLITEDASTFLMDAARHPKRLTGALTPRQREVLQLVAEGQSMKQVASVLDISSRTAEAHKYQIMEKLGVQTTAELVQYAVKIGLVSVSSAPREQSQQGWFI
jgi:DNA-binding NarL/FixJ family response regulator